MPTRSVILKQGNSRETIVKIPGAFLRGGGNLDPADNDTNERTESFLGSFSLPVLWFAGGDFGNRVSQGEAHDQGQRQKDYSRHADLPEEKS